MGAEGRRDLGVFGVGGGTSGSLEWVLRAEDLWVIGMAAEGSEPRGHWSGRCGKGRDVPLNGS